MKTYYVYIITNNSGTLYVGVTSNLEMRMAQHRSGNFPGFTTKYNIKKLMYIEQTSDVSAAIAREKQLKGWNRSKKIALIEKSNAGWQDLSIDASTSSA